MGRETPNVDDEEVEKILVWICCCCFYGFVLFCSLTLIGCFGKQILLSCTFYGILVVVVDGTRQSLSLIFTDSCLPESTFFLNRGANVLDLLLLRDDWWTPCYELLACLQQSLLEFFSPVFVLMYKYWILPQWKQELGVRFLAGVFML